VPNLKFLVLTVPDVLGGPKIPEVGHVIWTDLSSIFSGITRMTDGQTDKQMDRILIARPRLHFMQRGENRSRK